MEGSKHGGSGRRILVVEDNFHVAKSYVNALTIAGHEVVGPVGTVRGALGLIDQEQSIDAAILDVNLGAEEIYPVADALRERGVPFALLTGYGAGAIAPGYADVPTFQKPALIVEVLKAFWG